jgi:hypothetical protein
MPDAPTTTPTPTSAGDAPLGMPTPTPPAPAAATPAPTPTPPTVTTTPAPTPPVVTTPATTATPVPTVPAPTPVPPAAAATTPPATTTPAPTGTPVTMPSGVLRDRLNRAKETGAAGALAAVEAEAKALGYDTYQAMLDHLRSLGGTPPAPAPASGAAGIPPTAASPEVAALQSQIQGLEARLNTEQAARAKAELDAVLAAGGVTEVDFVADLLARHKKGLPEAELKSFDTGKFIEDLRGKKPFLFKESVKPVTTGPGTGGTPPAPSPGVTTQNAAKNEQVDVRKLKQEDYQARLRELGINPHSQPA